ncbi:Predicted glycosyl transferase [Maridesulfovibrio ferrireducens]|uniref:Predicted glycosyl transferase n=1 Tax=Maridesulfovibrio ferrireducens TaxID=246191 RepID=A0A1G9HU44_9BACT|nr:glycosyltransferase [Maridesulfovibrio ferrireducens]SDL16488.1 Predicted glycosyl transferase [Maridesulfovibrio ferrireducens]
MKIIHYCQHVLGMGHFFRSLEISRALKNEQVIFVAGGTRPEQELPDHVEYFQLPGLCMNENFGGLMPTDEGRLLNEVKEERIEKIKAIFEQERPDVFLIELFPFGRKAFRFELLPILDSIKAGLYGDVKVICSLRDILVEKDDGGKHEKRCVETLNKYFDMLLIHSDPQIAKLDETFQSLNNISIPYSYTGFAARKPRKNVRSKVRKKLGIGSDENLLVASAGGGKVGNSLLKAVFDSFAELGLEKTKLLILTGPFLDQNKYDALKTDSLNFSNITVEKFAPDFTDLLTGADAMISMAGYNTCMDILTTNIPSAVLPFAQNREQRMRAEKLAEHTSLKVLNDNDLSISRMKNIINELLTCERSSSDHNINLEGATESARAIRMVGTR